MKLLDAVTMLALIGALAACSGASRSGASTAGLGERIYSGNCVPCHQQSGAGIPGVYPSLAGSPVVLGDPAELARWVIKGQRPAGMPAGRYSTQMLQFGWMKPADAAALLSYLRLNFGNSGTSVDAAAVAKAIGQ
ncbi:MAG TPA: cytochrome c [Steroidobacteraceae bacterium]|jgi:mono/diheme cytochrome c family protein|nr:cytochrome c [Steroidobacteraceae bacterium]